MDGGDRTANDRAASTLVGRRIGGYELLERVGAGGMGEVYRARDTRLGRDVAVKVLPSAYAADPERRSRLEREARVLASLSHPNIAAIYGVEDAPSDEGHEIHALVMELIDGETLADRLRRGRVSPKEALSIARPIAEALEAAHERGIVHRDLKPANVKIAPDGLVKVLDFGLAKATDPLTQPGLTQAATVAPDATRAGIVLGTAAYMSPEQARGQPVDKRTDIWAFGCVLYEMLAGRSAFGSETASDTLVAILDGEPDWAALPAGMPASIAALLKRCLEKDPKRRLRDIGDARIEIEDTLAAPSTKEAAPGGDLARSGGLPASRALRLGGALAGAAVIIAAAVVGWSRLSGEAPRNPLAGARFTRLTDWDGAEQQAAISRDGRYVAFVSDRDGAWDAWVGQVGAGSYRNLTNGAVPELLNPAVRNVSFTPDGALVTLWVRLTDPVRGVQTDGWVVPTIGGPLRPHMDRYADNIADVDWTPAADRLVYHTSDAGDPVFVTNTDEIRPQQVLAAEPGMHNHFPVWSPDAAFIYFVRGFPPNEMDIWRIRATGGEPERLTLHESRVSFPTFLDARTLLYLASAEDGSGPWIHSMDVERRVSQRISTGVEEYTSIAASADGRRLVATVSRITAGVWRAPVDSLGIEESRAERLTLPTARGVSPRLAAEYLIYHAPTASTDGIWKLADGEAPVELWSGRDGRIAAAPAIAPDGGRIVFPVRRRGVTRLYIMGSDGSGARALADDLEVRGAPAWSPDGRWIAIAAIREGQPVLFKIPVDGGESVPLLSEYSSDPAWSPSGRYLVYSGADVGMVFPLRAVTAEGAPHPMPEVMLSRGSRRVAFLGRDNELVVLKGDLSHKELWVIDLETGAERQLTAFGPGFTIQDFDVSADGDAIVFDRTKDESDIVLIERQPQ